MQSLAPPSVKTTGTGATRLDRDVKRWREEELAKCRDILLRREHDEREARARPPSHARPSPPPPTSNRRPTRLLLDVSPLGQTPRRRVGTFLPP